MKIDVLSVLLLIAVASSLSDDPHDEKQDGMCPRDFFKKYPEKYKMIKEKRNRKHMPDYSKMTDCAATGVCEDNLKCCQTPCGMKCMKPLFDNSDPFEEERNGNEESPENEEESNSERDEKLGMCPLTFLLKYPDFKKKLFDRFKSHSSYPTDTLCKEGQKGPGCLKKNAKNRENGKPPMKISNFTKMADCTVDGDCANNMRCCRSPCGKKCMKGIFLDESLVKQIDELMENKREKRDLSENHKENNGDEHGKGREHQKGHGNGEGHENVHGKGHRKGGHGKDDSKGGENGKRHGKRHGEGGEHVKGNGKRHKEGGERGKDHGKTGKHGKEHGKGEGHEMGQGK